ncbi:uncharacterized protein LOC120078273 isoform X2 [Benincasa hispida]|uniref:uncharacterized protein LOC120078273 isoform X2 n=1 Tax=Benincasa hispida TaxID=102211 RepID=UPI00190203DF|nr:uncharacterized protein LOC120078273 isoform X2 [Benincasa hispida]
MISLRNLMEEKQLDFNQPLLSVRRFTSTETSSETNEKCRPEPKIPPLPVYKSDLKSGPVRIPGTVPFIWEQTPGKPKDESSTKTQISKRPPLVPKLPPGRVQKVNQEVPTSVSASLDENAREAVEEMTSCKSGNDDEEEEEEVYKDANDRFSRSESFFLNCSISGVSGLDDSEIKSSGASSMDPHTRDFMMDRFLPAAKAMASETPPHTIRKQTVSVERPREIKLVTNGDRESRPNLHVQTKHVKEIFREESDDEDDDYDESGYASTRGCGFLPRCCLKGSFVLLNPVTGMRMQATSSSKDAVNQRRSSHGQRITKQHLEENAMKSSKNYGRINIQEGDTFSLYRHLQSEGISNYTNEPSQAVHDNVNPSLGYTEKATNSATNEYDKPRRKSLNSFQALLSDESGSASPVEKTLYIDSVHKIKSPHSSSNSYMKGISYGGDMIDDDFIQSTEMKELCTLDSATLDVKNLNAVGEKNILRPGSLKSVDSCLHTCSDKSLFDVKMDSNYSRFKPEHAQDASKLTSSRYANNKKFDLENQFPLKPSSRGDSNGLAKDNTTLYRKQPEKSSYEGNDIVVPEFGKKQELDGEKLGPVDDSPDVRTSEGATNGKKDSRNQFLKRVGNEDGSHNGYSRSRLPFAPPPPKSPSESWLKRTLPTSSKNTSFLQSSFAMRVNPVSMAASPDCKIHSTVKSSNINHPHLQFSKELLSSIPEV